MEKQSYKNHTQIVYSYYIFTGLPIIALIVLAICKIVKGADWQMNDGYLFLIAGWILLTMLFRSRGFALKAQDRAIRAEENLRYFQLTGKRMDGRLKLSQIIALRFASDEELPSLAQKAAAENLSNKDIKQLIKDWRGDLHRV